MATLTGFVARHPYNTQPMTGMGMRLLSGGGVTAANGITPIARFSCGFAGNLAEQALAAQDLITCDLNTGNTGGSPNEYYLITDFTTWTSGNPSGGCSFALFARLTDFDEINDEASTAAPLDSDFPIAAPRNTTAVFGTDAAVLYVTPASERMTRPFYLGRINPNTTGRLIIVSNTNPGVGLDYGAIAKGLIFNAPPRNNYDSLAPWIGP